MTWIKDTLDRKKRKCITDYKTSCQNLLYKYHVFNIITLGVIIKLK